MNQGNFGIVVSGGPAPGINSAIHSVVIEAHNAGHKTFGFMHGFRGVCQGEKDGVIELSIEQVSRVYSRGGSILSTSRFNPFASPEFQERFSAALKQHAINKLVVIGGEGSAWISHHVAASFPSLKVAHIPKTIDNDLVLPNDYPSFGFESARYAGAQILNTLMVDSATCESWHVVTSMGRRAGFLALGLGLAAGATLTIIPEEFNGNKVKLSDVAQIIFGSVKKRLEAGKRYGLAVVAEGVLDAIDPTSSPELSNCPRDEMGRLHYANVEISALLVSELRRLAQSASISTHFVAKNIGYELRCHDPVPFDIEYTRFLGYGAVNFLLQGKTDILVTRLHDQLGFLPLQEMALPDGSMRSRRVDVKSELYLVARSFMVR